MNLALDRLLPRALIAIALTALCAGGVAWALAKPEIADWIWAAGAVPVIVGLTVSIVRDLLARRFGVDAVALLSMVGALALWQNLAAIVVTVMYAGGNPGRLVREQRPLPFAIGQCARGKMIVCLA